MVCDSLGFFRVPFSVGRNCFTFFLILGCPDASITNSPNEPPTILMNVSQCWVKFLLHNEIENIYLIQVLSNHFFLPGSCLIPFLGCPLSSKIFTEDWLKNFKKVLSSLSLLTVFINSICYLLGGRATVFLTHLSVMIWDEVLCAPC